MPVIVVGADTPPGRKITAALLGRDGEVRAFVSDPDAVADLRRERVKTALGDVSDGSHVGGAAMGCFSAVVIAVAARDERERSFATTPNEVHSAWAEGLADAGVSRVIWVGEGDAPEPIAEIAADVIAVDDGRADLAAEVRRIDDALSI